MSCTGSGAGLIFQLKNSGADGGGEIYRQRALFRVPCTFRVVVCGVCAAHIYVLVAAQEIHGQRAAAVRRAASPHGDVRFVRGFKAQRDPRVRKVRRAERPERQRALDVAADCLVIIERFLNET